MVHFNELRISENGKNLIIDVEVDMLSYYNDVYIESIQIDVDDNYIDSGASSKAVTVWKAGGTSTSKTIASVSDTGCVDVQTQTLSGKYAKHVELCLTPTDLAPLTLKTFGDDIFFVYVNLIGTPAACTPCGYDESPALGVVFNKYKLYCSAMGFVKQLGDDCDVDKRWFLDFIMRYYAFMLCLKTGNYEQAIVYWDKYLNRVNTTTSSSGISTRRCGCHGHR